MSILDEIVEVKRQEVAQLIPRVNELKTVASARKEFRDFKKALQQENRISLIAEVKKASPSAGIIQPNFDPVTIATQYQTGGASALSVLTDEKFFQGHIGFLEQIRSAVDLPLLRKDFIINEVQIYEAVARGADAILLIVAILTDDQLQDLHSIAENSGLAVLVEVHDEHELERAFITGAEIIGINNRDLRDFSVNLSTTERLASKIKSGAHAECMIVAESGIHARADVERLARAGVDSILVGESLMRSDDLAAKVKELIDT